VLDNSNKANYKKALQKEVTNKTRKRKPALKEKMYIEKEIKHNTAVRKKLHK
jgi:hypothetical protein